ncbi:hypothetical protein [Cellulomonas soli]|uniref:Uncharacterized protein n=1 Tax=Cellulomonas soli TaxID=931535 RepID=A0A512PCB3_9CELL|nr:hypothetical protein [Cellulomonas soli]NYI58433.1 hypothetical protein [Cellulomonas soli]GEP68855.1 hypothetical protein CSO01_15700 [Cellulomonas soli]
MSHDEAFVAHLKNLEVPPPPLPIDRRRILAIGRRRRGTRAAVVSAVSAVAVAGLVTAAVAALPGPDYAAPPATTPTATPTTLPAPEPSATPAHAVIDPITGLVTTPFSTFLVSQHDLDIMGSAWDLARSRCMADAGYADNFVFAVQRTALPDMSRPYGIWNSAEVRQRGYAEPQLDPYDGEGSTIDISSAAVEAALDSCNDQVWPMGFIVDPTSFDDSKPAVGAEFAGYTPEGSVVIAEWTACLEAHDVAPPDEEGSLQPAGVLSMSLEEQVRIGLIDIGCKESTDLRQRLADIDAVNQQAYLDSAPAYVAAYTAAIESALSASRAYLEAAGIDMP